MAGLIAGYGIAVPMGPVGTYLVSLTARTRLAVGLAGASGVASVDGGYALAATLGGAALANALAPYSTALKWISVVVLLGVAAGIVRGALRTTPDTDAGATVTAPWRAFLVFLGLTAINPATVAYFAALVTGLRGSASFGVGEQVQFVLAVFVASLSWQVVLAVLGATLGRVLSGQRAALITALVSAALTCYLALRLLLA
jgi:arginine exporter protein ArgO